MNSICIRDSVYIPGTKKLTVEETLNDEIKRMDAGFRREMTYDRVVKTSFDPKIYLESGYEYIPVADDERPIDYAVTAVKKLLDRNCMDPCSVDGFIFYDAIPWAEDVAINMPSCIAEKTKMEKLKYCAHFTQRNCSSGLAAIEVARYVMLSRPDIKTLVLAGGDCVDTKSGEPRVIRNLIFSDAGSAVLMGRTGLLIDYINSRFIPKGGRRYREDLKVLLELSTKGLHLSFSEMKKACADVSMGPDDFEHIVTNNPLVNRAMDLMPEYPSGKRVIIDNHVRRNALATAHIIIGCLEVVIKSNIEKPVIMHTTGLGTTLCTMILSPRVIS